MSFTRTIAFIDFRSLILFFFYLCDSDAIRDEIKALKKEYKDERRTRDEGEKSKDEKAPAKEKDTDNELIQDYLMEQRKYGTLKKEIAKKGDERQQFTLQLLNKFKSKLENARKSQTDTDSKDKATSDNDDEDLTSDKWLTHELQFEEKVPILAKDASTKKDDWYDVYDPRNPINKRKRGEGSDRDHGKRSRSGRR